MVEGCVDWLACALLPLTSHCERSEVVFAHTRAFLLDFARSPSRSWEEKILSRDLDGFEEELEDGDEDGEGEGEGEVSLFFSLCVCLLLGLPGEAVNKFISA